MARYLETVSENGHELKVPTVGESITEVQIGKWLKSEGQRIGKDENLVEIESDKATVDLPAPMAGVVTQVLHGQGDVVAVGDGDRLSGRRRGGGSRFAARQRLLRLPPRSATGSDSGSFASAGSRRRASRCAAFSRAGRASCSSAAGTRAASGRGERVRVRAPIRYAKERIAARAVRRPAARAGYGHARRGPAERRDRADEPTPQDDRGSGWSQAQAT